MKFFPPSSDGQCCCESCNNPQERVNKQTHFQPLQNADTWFSPKPYWKAFFIYWIQQSFSNIYIFRHKMLLYVNANLVTVSYQKVFEKKLAAKYFKLNLNKHFSVEDWDFKCNSKFSFSQNKTGVPCSLTLLSSLVDIWDIRTPAPFISPIKDHSKYKHWAELRMEKLSVFWSRQCKQKQAVALPERSLFSR